jgi:hypothetical protein
MLASLNALADFRVSAEDADPRGWPLLVGTGIQVATVADLIVDTDAARVCYLECVLDPDRAHGHTRQRVLIPIGYARLDEDACQVIVDLIDVAELDRLPAFHGLPVSETMDAELHAFFTRDDARPK